MVFPSWKCGSLVFFNQQFICFTLPYRDMIREADGMALMSMWRLNMPRFWSGNHYKYLTIAHRLLSGVSGWYTPRMIHEVIHNRTVNLRGGKGQNVAMDRACEFLNAEFKGNIKTEMVSSVNLDFIILRKNHLYPGLC